MELFLEGFKNGTPPGIPKVSQQFRFHAQAPRAGEDKRMKDRVRGIPNTTFLLVSDKAVSRLVKNMPCRPIKVVEISCLVN